MEMYLKMCILTSCKADLAGFYVEKCKTANIWPVWVKSVNQGYQRKTSFLCAIMQALTVKVNQNFAFKLH